MHKYENQLRFFENLLNRKHFRYKISLKEFKRFFNVRHISAFLSSKQKWQEKWPIKLNDAHIVCNEVR